MEESRIILGNATGEITEKRSRFIANVFEIHSEEEAVSLIESVRKQYYDARHNCYAYILGQNQEIQRFSDDKEPQGTAGKPILEVIRSGGYRNTLIVVTRYFGGILLGTGGLIRAYTQAAKEGLKNADAQGLTSPVRNGCSMQIVSDYTMSGKLQYIISQMEIPVSDTRYAEKVTFCLVVPDNQKNTLVQKITEATNAASEIIYGDNVTYILKDGIPVTYTW